MAAAIGVGEKDKATPQPEKKSPEPEQAKSEASSGPSSVESKELPTAVKKKTSSVSRSSANEQSKPEFPPHPAVVIPTTMTETTVTGGQSREVSPKEQGKVSSWLKSKFSRRASRTIKPEDAPTKAGKAPEPASPVIKEEQIFTRTTEPITGLPVDPSNATPGFGTDDIPHVKPATASEVDGSEAKDKAIVIEPTTGLPMDTSKSSPGFGTDNIPHIAAVSEGPASTAQAVSPVPPVEADAAQAKENFADPDTVTTATPAHSTLATSDPNSSERDVAPAGRDPPPAPLRRERSHSTSISSLSSDEPTTTTTTNTVAGAKLKSEIAASRGRPMSGEAEGEGLRKGSNATQGSSVGGEEFEEARDAFDAEQLPLPSFRAAEGRRDSPVRETRFKEEL